MTGLFKLDQLHLKTDRQLIQLASNELEIGVREAGHALNIAENWNSAEGHYRKAKEACDEAIRLLSLARRSRGDERSGVDAKLEQLKEMLEALSIIASTKIHTEDEIAAVALVLWKARGCPAGLPEEDWFRAERMLKVSLAACLGS